MIDIPEIVKVFQDYQILHLEDAQNFIGQLKHEFNSLNSDEYELIVIRADKPRLSKCMGCSFGSTISAYRYEYKKRYGGNRSKNDYFDIVYTKEFGVIFKIVNDVLVDIGVCNAFLTKEECDELNACR